ncbi:MAG: caspase family protein [Pseudomonadota bacterium]
MSKYINLFIYSVLALLALYGCSSQTLVSKENQTQAIQANDSNTVDADKLLVVDCLLPGQIRKLGTSHTFISPRRPTRTTAVDCEIRGGEYVSYDRADYRTALNVWLESAREGDAKSQVYVGEIFEKGPGTVPDYTQAAAWYRKAAIQGNSRGAINLGYLYEKGLGVEKNTLEALNWYRKASGLEDDDLQFASTIEAANEEQLGHLREELNQSQNELASIRARLSTKEQQLKREQTALNSSEQSLRELNQELDRRRNLTGSPDYDQISELQNELQEQQATVARQREENATLKSRLEKQGNLFDQELEASRQQQQQRQQQLEQDMAQQREELNKLRVELGNSRQQLASAEHQLRESKSQLIAEQDKASQAYQALASTTSKKQYTVQQLQGEIKRQEADIEQLQANLNREQEQARHLEQKLQQELTTQRQETVALSSQYNQSQLNLAEAETRLEKLEVQLTEEQNKTKHAREALAESSDTNLAEIQRLDAEVRRREAELDTQRGQIARLQSEMTGQQNQMKSIQEANTRVALQGPSIEILDPPVILSRGIPSVQLRSVMKERSIVGKVTAPSGLLSLSVNDHSQTPDEFGIFKTRVPVEDRQTLVNVVAIDKQGKSAAVSFELIQKLRLASTSRPESERHTPARSLRRYPVDFGDYYALIIGNNNYTNFPNLNSAINDAQMTDKILREKYGFKTTLILDANRYSVLSTLNKFREELTEDDNLLIYYAGHGELDQVNLRGHWLPVDAEPNSTANWISNVDITDILNAISARHVMVVADSCYSGTMTRSSLARLESGMSDENRLKWFKVMARTRSRSVLTSGGLKPVLDSGSGNHSVFANAFFKVLNDNNNVLEGYKVYRQVSDQVRIAAARYNLEQTPQYAPILHGGHEAGEFFFVPSRILSSQPAMNLLQTASQAGP